MSTAALKKVERNELATASPSERFTLAVMKEFPSGDGNMVELTSFQRKLIQNYFIKLDGVLNEAEVKRTQKSEQYRDALEFSWKNVNMNKLAQDVVAYSSIGLDPLQKNHIFPIPYKNTKTNKFDIQLQEGYNGMELKARKYGYDVPDDVIFELKYSTDVFKSHKRSFNIQVETYDFEITNDFDRGVLEGGFYYMMFYDTPEKNRLVVRSRGQIEKRKPKYASAEFWGGEKDEWKNGKKTGKKEKIEGWEEEMFLKTLKRHCWGSVNIDSQKIDDFLMRVLENENQSNDRAVEEQIEEHANKKGEISIEAEEVEAEEAQEIEEPSQEEENQRAYDEAMAEENQPKNEPDF